MYALAFSPPCHFTLECQGPFTALTTSGLVFRSLTNWFSLSTLSSLRTFSLSCPCIIFLPRRNLQRCSSAHRSQGVPRMFRIHSQDSDGCAMDQRTGSLHELC